MCSAVKKKATSRAEQSRLSLSVIRHQCPYNLLEADAELECNILCNLHLPAPMHIDDVCALTSLSDSRRCPKRDMTQLARKKRERCRL